MLWILTDSQVVWVSVPVLDGTKGHEGLSNTLQGRSTVHRFASRDRSQGITIEFNRLHCNIAWLQHPVGSLGYIFKIVGVEQPRGDCLFALGRSGIGIQHV